MLFENYLQHLKESDEYDVAIADLKKKAKFKDIATLEKKMRAFRSTPSDDKKKQFKDMFGVDIEPKKEEKDNIDKELEELKGELDVQDFSQLKAKFNSFVQGGSSKEDALEKAKEIVLPRQAKEKEVESNKNANFSISFPVSTNTDIPNFKIKFTPNVKTIMWKKGVVENRDCDISVYSSFSLDAIVKDKILTMPSLYSTNENVLEEEITKLSNEIKKIVDVEIKKLDVEIKKLGFEVKDIKTNLTQDGEEE